MPRITIIKIITIALVGVIAIAILNKKDTNTVQLTQKSPYTTEQVTSLTGQEIAVRIASYLDTTMKTDGTFEPAYHCDKTIRDICVPIQSSGPPHSGQIVLAYYELSKKTGNDEYKQKADRALDVFLAQCKSDGIYCEWNFFPLYYYYKDTGDEKYKDAMLLVADRFLEEKSLLEFVTSSYGPKLAQLYEITGEKKYLVRLENVANSLLRGELDNEKDNPMLYKEGDFVIREQSLLSVWSVYLPAYNATKNPKYLKVAQEIFDRGSITAHFGEFKKKDDVPAFIVALESLLALSEIIDPKSAYLDQAGAIGQELLTSLSDTPGNMRYKGDYSFLQHFRENADRKSTLQNGWLARLYLHMDQKSFKFL